MYETPETQKHEEVWLRMRSGQRWGEDVGRRRREEELKAGSRFSGSTGGILNSLTLTTSTHA